MKFFSYRETLFNKYSYIEIKFVIKKALLNLQVNHKVHLYCFSPHSDYGRKREINTFSYRKRNI